MAGYGRLSGNAENLHHDSAGFLAGEDMPVLPAVRLGIEGGYTANTARTPGRLSTASGDSGHVGGYAVWTEGLLRIDIGGDLGFGSVRIGRAVPQLGLTSSSSQDQESDQAFADLGYRVALDSVTLEPHAGIAHVAASSGAFAETGSIAALSGNEKSDSASFTMLGVRANVAELPLGWGMVLSPRLDLGWQHALAPVTPYQTVSLTNAVTSFQVLGTPLVEDAGTIQAGFELTAGRGVGLFVSYDGSLSYTVESHAFRGGLDWRF